MLLLDQVVQGGRPLPDTADVQSELTVDLGRGADGEGVPLVGGDGRDVDENPIAGAEVEACGSLDDEAGHLGGKDHSCFDCCIPGASAHLDQSDDHLNEPDAPGRDDTFPVRWSMEDEKREESPVEKVGEVEDVEVSSSADERKSADEHD